MPVFSMPIIVKIEADSMTDAQNNLDEWGESFNIEDITGGESIELSPEYEFIDGLKVISIHEDELQSDIQDDSDTKDDFSEDEFDY